MSKSLSVVAITLLTAVVHLQADEGEAPGTGGTKPATDDVATPDDAAKAAVDSPGEDDVAHGISLTGPSIEEHWTHFASRDDVALKDVWSLSTASDLPVLTCVGAPKAFLLTKKEFHNFEMTFEWRYTTDPNGNSGILVFTRNEPRLWPTSMQVQLHQPRAGAIFPSGDAKSDNSTAPETGLALSIGEWNKCRIVAENGRLSVQINDHEAGEVSGCEPATGHIAIQSEGSETQFRRIVVKEIATEAADHLPETVLDPPAAGTNPSDDGAESS